MKNHLLIGAAVIVGLAFLNQKMAAADGEPDNTANKNIVPDLWRRIWGTAPALASSDGKPTSAGDSFGRWTTAGISMDGNLRS